MCHFIYVCIVRSRARVHRKMFSNLNNRSLRTMRMGCYQQIKCIYSTRICVSIHCCRNDFVPLSIFRKSLFFGIFVCFALQFLLRRAFICLANTLIDGAFTVIELFSSRYFKIMLKSVKNPIAVIFSRVFAYFVSTSLRHRQCK